MVCFWVLGCQGLCFGGVLSDVCHIFWMSYFCDVDFLGFRAFWVLIIGFLGCRGFQVVF